MKKVRSLVVLLLFSAFSSADVRNCVCELSSPESMAKRECGLCREAEKQPPDGAVFFLKDINPRKPNRWLALPRAHIHSFAEMTPEQRTAFWTAAIRKATELFGDRWGLAYNGDASRTQCHAHVHIGKLLDDVETQNFVEVDGPADIPIARDGSGFWIHPNGSRLHVHLGEEITETVLLR
jgi:CDP-diacylglycerol pyrophosphatase